MFIDNTFKIALAVSLAVHTLILAASPYVKAPHFEKKSEKLEVTYIRPKPKPEIKKIEPQPFKELKIQAKEPPPFIEKQDFLKVIKPDIKKPELELSKLNDGASKRKITLPPVGTEKIRNPTYLSYYQAIREKIKRVAYQLYTRQDKGEAYLSFLVSSDGKLKGIRLIEEKSSDNQYLRDISVRSIQNASPFPAFPKDLPYPELSFNVIISFETE